MRGGMGWVPYNAESHGSRWGGCACECLCVRVRIDLGYRLCRVNDNDLGGREVTHKNCSRVRDAAARCAPTTQNTSHRTTSVPDDTSRLPRVRTEYARARKDESTSAISTQTGFCVYMSSLSSPRAGYTRPAGQEQDGCLFICRLVRVLLPGWAFTRAAAVLAGCRRSYLDSYRLSSTPS